jgi:uncharacterized protein (TIGR02058 family)
MGLGTDLHGEDSTKAARRAVRDAINRTSLPGMRGLVDGDMSRMRVEVTVAVARPETVDAAAVAGEFPYGQVTVQAVEGGLRAPNGTMAGDGDDHLLCAVALVSVGYR